MVACNFDEIITVFTKHNSFEELETLKGVLEEIEKNPQGVRDILEESICRLTKQLLNEEICPECGEKMISVPCPEEDTYVPYGDTKVLYSEATYLACPNCGYVPEE